ncbi:MAG: Origin recognition complex subunit 2 [Caeruleum heppii]|nr:MAG: Origin recognition complex subunit 2 [Caeruleum heppii]
MAKRKRVLPDPPEQQQYHHDSPTPQKKARLSDMIVGESITLSTTEPSTPTKKKTNHRGRIPGSKNKPKPPRDGSITATPKGKSTPRSNAKSLFTTPTKKTTTAAAQTTPTSTPSLKHNAHRSARRKSVRKLIDRTLDDAPSSDDDLGEEDLLARRIWDEEDGDEEAEEEEEDTIEPPTEVPAQPSTAPTTPSKRPRGRPKGSTNRRKRTPTPPHDLPPADLYFLQNHGPRGSRTSSHTFSSLPLLSHAEYFSLIRQENVKDAHKKERRFLQDMYRSNFGQWAWELREGFNVCLYGWGRKTGVVRGFAEWLYEHHRRHHQFQKDETRKIIMINGYAPTLTPRSILHTLSVAIFGPTETASLPLPQLPTLLSTLTTTTPSLHLTLLTNSIDAPSLRRSAPQTLLAALASHPQISLLATANHPSFPLLWDVSLREAFSFVFHDCTTFEPFDGLSVPLADDEVDASRGEDKPFHDDPHTPEIDTVASVLECLGRKGRRLGGREGVGYVLRSLTGNARSLFRILVGELLSGLAAEEDDDDYEGGGGSVVKPGGEPDLDEHGVEYRALYQKAVEEFVCGNEMSFRGLLKEFHDHQIITTRKDAAGAEMLGLPFSRAELMGVLEDLVE